MKNCFKCNTTKDIDDFYEHPQMGDGHLNKCKDCTKADVSKRTVARLCLVCQKDFMTWPTEIKRGGGKTCSRDCYYERLRGLLDEKFAVKSNYHTIHKWIYKMRGKASKCEMCSTENAKAYHWSNVSGKYLQELTDWQELCAKCHHKYDRIAEKIWESRRRNGTVKHAGAKT